MSILGLLRLTAGDSGEYTCIASNKAGATSVSADMVVYGSCFCMFIFPEKNNVYDFFAPVCFYLLLSSKLVGYMKSLFSFFSFIQCHLNSSQNLSIINKLSLKCSKLSPPTWHAWHPGHLLRVSTGPRKWTEDLYKCRWTSLALEKCWMEPWS